MRPRAPVALAKHTSTGMSMRPVLSHPMKPETLPKTEARNAPKTEARNAPKTEEHNIPKTEPLWAPQPVAFMAITIGSDSGVPCIMWKPLFWTVVFLSSLCCFFDATAIMYRGVVTKNSTSSGALLFFRKTVEAKANKYINEFINQ